MPVAARAAVTAPEAARRRAREKPYSTSDALTYVFRGRGLYVFGSYLGLLAVLAFLSLFPLVGCAATAVMVIFIAAVLLLVPGALFAIARTTARGDDELPDWPDFSAFGERLGEILAFLALGLVAALPLAVLLRLAGCAGWGPMAPHCWLVLVAGWFAALLIWVPAFAAVAVFQEGWLGLRVDLHARAIFAGGADLAVTAVLATVLVVSGQVLSVVLAIVPLVGLVASAAAGMYGWFTAAHLVGLFYRRHHDELGSIYGYGE